MNNSVFEKTMENIRNRVDVRLVNDRKKAEKLFAKPNLKHWTIFDVTLIAVHLKKTNWFSTNRFIAEWQFWISQKR